MAPLPVVLVSAAKLLERVLHLPDKARRVRARLRQKVYPKLALPCGLTPAYTLHRNHRNLLHAYLQQPHTQ